MSFIDLVAEIVAKMEETQESHGSGTEQYEARLEAYVSMLSLLVKSERENIQKQSTAPPFIEAHNGLLLKKMVDSGEQASTKLKAQEEVSGTRFAEIVDGPDKGSFLPIDPQMPVSAKCFGPNAIYQLREDKRLYFLEEDTKKRREANSKVQV